MEETNRFNFDTDIGLTEAIAFVAASPTDHAFVARVDNDGRITSQHVRIVSWAVMQAGNAQPVLSRPLMSNETFCLIEKGSVYSPTTGVTLRDTQQFLDGIRNMVANWTDYEPSLDDEPLDDEDAE